MTSRFQDTPHPERPWLSFGPSAHRAPLSQILTPEVLRGLRELQQALRERHRHLLKTRRAEPQTDVTALEQLNFEIFPPGMEFDSDGGQGSKPIERHEQDFPRTQWASEVASHIDPKFSSHRSAPRTHGDQPYTALFLPTVGVCMFVCDQYGNATYIVPLQHWKGWAAHHKVEDVREAAKDSRFGVSWFEMTEDEVSWKARLLCELKMCAERNESVVGPSDWQRPVSATDSKDQEELIPDRKERLGLAPEGWMTNRTLARKLSIDHATSLRWAQVLTDLHPDWVKPYLDVIGHTRDHLAPEIYEIMKAKLLERRHAPEKWMTVRALSIKYGVHNITVKKTADKHYTAHPEWIEKFLDERDALRDHYSPELIEILDTILGNFERPSSDWRSQWNLVGELGISQFIIRDITNRFRIEKPDWFKFFRNKRNQSIEYFSPQLCEILRQEGVTRSKKIKSPS